PELVTDLATPALLDAAAAYVGPKELRAKLRVSASLTQHTDWIAGDAALGFERIFLHHVGKDQRIFIDDFARAVLPQFAAPSP
ncbi:MAG TPA: LLM class F420-dependent oxidoreductase, partial [Polyangia bacterium]